MLCIRWYTKESIGQIKYTEPLAIWWDLRENGVRVWNFWGSRVYCRVDSLQILHKSPFISPWLLNWENWNLKMAHERTERTVAACLSEVTDGYDLYRSARTKQRHSVAPASPALKRVNKDTKPGVDTKQSVIFPLGPREHEWLVKCAAGQQDKSASFCSRTSSWQRRETSFLASQYFTGLLNKETVKWCARSFFFHSKVGQGLTLTSRARRLHPTTHGCYSQPRISPECS
ncbi:hypothetical protein P4O66_021154, partial [Electrophorus voltai]